MSDDLQADVAAFLKASPTPNGRADWHEPTQWPAPTPLRGPRRPAFPVPSVLSDGRGWMEETAASTQTPVDLAAMVYLGTLAAAVRGRCEIEVREGWREPLTLYVATILPSGEGKSPVISRAARPLHDLEREMAEESRREVAQGQALYRAAQKRLEKAEREAANAEGPDRYAAEEKIRTLADELAGMSYPEIPRILADDTTPEALVSLLRLTRGSRSSRPRAASSMCWPAGTPTGSPTSTAC